MHTSKRFAIGIVAGLMAVSLIGCTEKGGGTPKKDEQVVMVRVNDEDGNNLNRVFPYKTRGRLNEVKMEIKDFNPEVPLVVETSQGNYGGAYHEGVLYYVGEDTNKEGGINGIYEEKKETTQIKVSDFIKEGENLRLEVPTGKGNKVVGANITSEGVGIPLEIQFKGNNLTVISDVNQLKDIETLELVTWVSKEKIITGGEPHIIKENNHEDKDSEK